jgi:hypothetical protein
MSKETTHHIGITTDDGETYGVVFTDENYLEAAVQFRKWACNPKLSFTHAQADRMCELILMAYLGDAY